MFFLSSVNRFNPSPLFSEHTSPQQHIPGRSPESLNWDFWKGGGRSQPCFNYNPLLQHITAIKSAWVALLSSPAQATAVVLRLSVDETRCSCTPQPGSPEVQQNPVTHSAASSLPGSSGLPRATNPKEQNEDESRWERGKGSVCVFIFIFISFTRLSFLGKREEESCSELVSCQASSPALLVQVLHRLCRVYNSNFWKHTEKSGPFQKQ